MIEMQTMFNQGTSSPPERRSRAAELQTLPEQDFRTIEHALRAHQMSSFSSDI